MKRLLFLLLLLGSCKFSQSLFDFPPDIEVFWLKAQNLASVQVDEAAFDVGMDLFDFVSVDGPFVCGTQDFAAGCFSPSQRLITWNTEVPHVIVTEGHHAILWFLGHRDWVCAPHFNCKEKK